MLGVEYYFRRISQKYKNNITLHSLLILMSRCRKLYSAVHHLATTFRLVNKKLATEKVEPLLDDRLRCSIKAFYNEHTLLPLKFVFGGNDILKLVRKRKWVICYNLSKWILSCQWWKISRKNIWKILLVLRAIRRALLWSSLINLKTRLSWRTRTQL